MTGGTTEAAVAFHASYVQSVSVVGVAGLVLAGHSKQLELVLV